MDKLELILINDWIFDPLKKTLTTIDTDKAPILTETLESKHASLLHCLIDKQDKIVSREQLIELVWNNRFIDDRTINATVSRLRKILGGNKEQYIKTHPKLGYSFTAPVKFIDRPTPEKIKVEQRATTSLTLYKMYAALITMVFFIILWLLLTSLDKAVITIIDDKIKIEPLTYSEGWEFQPALSQDKSLLAYVSLADEHADYHIHIQNIKTKQTIIIDEMIETTSPIWSIENNEVYYAAHINNQCFIKKLKVDKYLNINNIENITSCGGENTLPNMAISSDQQWLYYVFDESASSASIIQRIHLETKQIETLTAPPNKLSGDYGLSLSPDDKYISYIRRFNDDKNTVMIQDITSGEIEVITEKRFAIYSIAWTKNPNYLTFIDNTNTLYLTNIINKKTTAIFKHSEVIMEHTFISANELLLSFGDLYKANIKQVDLTENELKVESLIYSTFKDHSADIHMINDIKAIAFVSNRSGNYQIWLQKQGQLTQLTQFTQSDTYITDVLFSSDGRSILFKLNDQLKIFKLETNKVINITHPTDKIRNAIWSCDSNNEVIVIAQSSGVWATYKINLTDGSSSKFINAVTSIQSNCNYQQYIVTKQNKVGLYAYNLADNTFEKSVFFSKTLFPANDQWSVSENKLYKINKDGKHLIELNLLTRQEKIKLFTKKDILGFKVKEKWLIFNDLPPDDTFIGKITIPKKAETIISK
ncbi:MAG: winged helix-turn-helix domain-containing protein [Colwellia sp.]|nr:winged helix-turn-helix domain-containing protein [Colwellia sp.]